MIKILKPKQVAEILNVTVRTLQNWDNEGILIAKRNCKNRRYYTQDQINNLINNKEEYGDIVIYSRVSSRNQKNDLVKISFSVINHQLTSQKIKTDSKTRITVTAASLGYPIDYTTVKGKKLFGLKNILSSSQIKIFGAGIKISGDDLIANGGRLFYLVASGKNIIDARKKIYKELAGISVEGNNLHYRTDIGWRDVQRLNK